MREREGKRERQLGETEWALEINSFRAPLFLFKTEFTAD